MLSSDCPVFAPGEADYPAGLAPVTPQSYRAHLHATGALETTTDPDRKAALEKALLSKAGCAGPHKTIY